MADLYANYAELAAAETLGADYAIRAVRPPGTSWASIAIHGGGIEPGTSEVAEAVAGTSMRFYEFDAFRRVGSNTDLHITSANFDEPAAVALVTTASRCLSFHGFTGTTGVAETLIGGNDVSLRDRVMRALQAAGFTVTVASSEFPGVDPANICNRTLLGGGVQLELSRTLRESFFTDFTRAGRKNPAGRTAAFSAYVAAILSVTGLRGGMASMGSVNVSRWALLSGADDVDQVATFATDRLAAGGSEYVALVGRYTDPSNCYLARVDLTTTQQVVLTLRRRQAGVDTVLGTYTSPLAHAVGGFLSARFQMAKTVLRASVWAAGSPPPDWQLAATDSAFTTGQMGIRFILSSAYTGALPVTATVSGYAATPLLSVPITSTAANGPWTTDPTDYPLDIRVGGEPMTVAVITGTGLTQTATVSARGVNGVQRAWPAGTPVDVWAPAIAPL